MKTQTEIIKEFTDMHGDKFDYSLVDYKGLYEKVSIVCRKCGKTFLQSPTKHKGGQGCPFCYGFHKTTESFLEEVFKAHPENKEKYDYSNVEYVGAKEKIAIRCKMHNYIFMTTPETHLKRNHGCPKCAGNYNYCTEEWIDLLLERRPENRELFDYSLVKYKSAKEKIVLKCKTCENAFLVTPDNHANSNKGCPFCNESKGEQKIAFFLKENQISYIEQYPPPGCRNINQLYCDFFLPQYNLIIEYQGEQHYLPIDFFGGEEVFKANQYRDRLKRDYCKNNNIKELEISYKDFDRVEEILKLELL